jgi:hypothetical protein
VQSATWRYERERKPGGTIEAKFEASRLAKVIKKHLINALHDLTKGPGDEPPEDDEKRSDGLLDLALTQTGRWSCAISNANRGMSRVRSVVRS